MQDAELTWAEELEEKGLKKGLEKGLEKGREEGLLTGKRETLLRLLTAKFGPLPESATKLVQNMDSVDALDRYLERVLVARSLAEMHLDD